MKLNKFTYFTFKPLGNHTLKIMKKIPGNLLKKTWKNHGNIMEFCQSKKVGTLTLVFVHCYGGKKFDLTNLSSYIVSPPPPPSPKFGLSKF